MQELFLELVQLSLTGSLFVLAVMLVRIIFRKAPKWLFCLLWGVVALRLICPISVESELSLVPDRLASGQIISNVGSDYVGEVNIIYENNAEYSNAVEAGRQPIYSDSGYYVVTEKDSYDAPATVEETVYPVLSWIWLVGMVLMLTYTAVSYLALKRKMEEATLLRDNIWQCEQAESPFVLGIIKPRIYLPYQISDSDMDNVIAHELAHIHRKDHWWKPIGFMLLSVHWFNPVMWVAYILLCRDIEAACDEKVIKHMEKDEMRAYSTALLHCSVHRRRIAACPLAFGEVGVKERIKRVMNYKKPAFWIIILAIAASIIAGIFLLTDPIRTVDGVKFAFKADDIQNIEMYHFEGIPTSAEKKTITDEQSIQHLYQLFNGLTLQVKETKDYLSASVTSFRFNLADGSCYELIYCGYGVKNGELKSPTGNFEYFTTADIGWNWRWLNEELEAVPVNENELPGYDNGLLPNAEASVASDDYLRALIVDIVDNPECAASSNPFDYIIASQRKYNEILTYGEDAVNFYVGQLRTGINGLSGYIMAVACAEITGIGDKYDGADWATAQEWLSLYDSNDHDIIIPKLIATDYISGQQAKLQSFGYSVSKEGEELIACGIALWQAEYESDETLVLDGKNGQNQILLAPQGFTLHRYSIYLPDGSVYDDGTRTLYDSLSPRVMQTEQGICLIAPFHVGEFFYEIELAWPEKDLAVTYGLKVVMTGKESSYDIAVSKIFERYGEGNPLIAASLVDSFTLANAVSSEKYYVFEVENLTEGTKRIAVSADGKTMYEISPEDELTIVAPIEDKPAMSFAGLEFGDTMINSEVIVVEEDGATLDYHLTYGSAAIKLEFGLISFDGTELKQYIEHGTGQGTIKDIPAGKYHLFVRNVGFASDLPGEIVEGGAVVCELLKSK